MATHYSDADEKGNFKVWYDTPDENPNYREDGEMIELAGSDITVGTLAKCSPREFDGDAHNIIQRLHTMACEKLGAGTVYEIRAKIPTNYGRGRGLAWYTTHWLQTAPLEEALPYPGKINELGGYMYLGRFKVPG